MQREQPSQSGASGTPLRGSRRRGGLWTLGGLAISAAAIGLLWSRVDLAELLAVGRRFELAWLPLYLLIAWATWLCLGLRWWQMLDGRLGVAEACAAWVFGLGTNQVVPARGGDALRIVFSARRAGWSVGQVLGRAASERVVDLAVLLACGLVAVAWTGARAEPRVLGLLAGVLLVALLVGILLRFANAPLVAGLARAAERVGLRHRFDAHLRAPLQDLGRFLRMRRLRLPLALTLLAWAGLSVAGYAAVAAALGVDLAYPELLLLLFAGATSLAVPSAPGGLGVFHAALWSGFLLLGRDGATGLAFATIVHALQLGAVALLVLMLVPVWIRAGGAAAAAAAGADGGAAEQPTARVASR